MDVGCSQRRVVIALGQERLLHNGLQPKDQHFGSGSNRFGSGIINSSGTPESELNAVAVGVACRGTLDA